MKIYSADFGGGIHIYSPSDNSDVKRDIDDRNFDDVVKLVDDKESTCCDKFIVHIKTKMQPGSVLLIEDPHMQPRKKNTRTPSKAQPWTEDQARSIIQTCRDCRITLKYVPGKQAPRNRAEAGVSHQDKCDEIDAMCIYYVYSNRPKAIKGLKNPPNPDEPDCFEVDAIREESYNYKKENDCIMNNLRFLDYECDMVDWLNKHLETLYDCLDDEESRSVFELANDNRKGAKNIKYWTYNEDHTYTNRLSSQASKVVEYLKTNGTTTSKTIMDEVGCTQSPLITLERNGVISMDIIIQKGTLSGKLNALTALLSTIMTEDGMLRTRKETAARPGWDYCKKYVLRMSPHHHRGGVARSNLYWHTLKNWIIAEGKKHPDYVEGGNFDFKRRIVDEKSKKKDNKSFPIRRGHLTKEEDIFFVEKRKVFSKAAKKLWQKMRDLIIKDSTLEYLDSVLHSEQSEFTKLSRTPEGECSLIQGLMFE